MALILLADIQVCEVTDGKSYDSSVFSVVFILKHYDRRRNSSSNSPRVVARTTLHDPHDKIKLEKAQYGLRFWLWLDDVTIREVLRKLYSYIALNPQPRRLEVIIVQIIMKPVGYSRDDEVMSWLRELEHDRKIKLWTNIRAEDMDFKDDEEYCCPICLDNMAVQKQKVLPVTRMTWSHMFSVLMKYFTKQNQDDAFKEFTKLYDTMVMKMICNHVFHRTCILNWMESSASCPVCRLDLRKLTGFERPFLEI